MDFQAPQFQNADLLGSFIRGRQAAQEQQIMPLQIAAMQQGVEKGGLELQQLRQMMGMKQAAFDNFQKALGGQQQGAQAAGAPTGGIQNGPQGAPAQSVPYNPADPLQSFIQNRQGVMMAGADFAAQMALASGGDPNKPYADLIANDQAALKDQQERTKLAAAPKIADATSLLTAKDPEQIVLGNALNGNPSYMQAMKSYFPRLGINPNDPKNMTADNIRNAAQMYINDLKGSYGEAPDALPHQLKNVAGPYGQLLQVDPVTGKATQVSEQKMPTFAMEKRFNPQTGHEEGVMVQTSPGGGNSPLARGGGGSGNAAPGGFGQAATAPVDLGLDKPTNDNLKAATFAGYARDGISGMSQMEQAGYRMSPTVRAIVLDAAVNEEPGKMISQLLSQEALAHKLSPQDKQYMASLLPVLQAAGHSMAGARLTQSQMRTNFESLIPVGKKDDQTSLTLVTNNRNNLYHGLLAQSGTAAQMPEFINTLGRDRAEIAAGAKPSASPGTPYSDPAKEARYQAWLAKNRK